MSPKHQRRRGISFKLPAKPKGITDQQHLWWAERWVEQYCTPREYQAFQLAQKFRNLSPIAARMKVSPARVSNLLSRVKRKLTQACRNPIKKEGLI